MRYGLLTILFLGVGLSSLSLIPSAHAQSTIADDQVLPWPWAMQCQFPWGEIDGNWLVNSPESDAPAEDRFEFKTEYVALDGTHFYEVRRYDRYNNLVARGRGFSPHSVKIIRVAMIELDERGESLGRNYWAIVGAYQEDKAADCSGGLTTVITLRTRGDRTLPVDVHYIVSKAPHEQDRIRR